MPSSDLTSALKLLRCVPSSTLVAAATPLLLKDASCAQRSLALTAEFSSRILTTLPVWSYTASQADVDVMLFTLKVRDFVQPSQIPKRWGKKGLSPRGPVVVD